MMKIEKGIPLPENSENKTVDLISAMEIGDSFFTEASDVLDHSRKRSRVYVMLAKWKDKKFTTRKVKGGLRTWRIE